MEELVIKARNGDKKAFSELIIILRDDLYRIARVRLDNEDDICEAVQETVVKSYVSIKKLKHSEYFKTWIIKILINECNKIYKRKNNFVQFNEQLNMEDMNNEIRNSTDEIDFIYLIKKLNYKEQMLITLYYSDEMSIKEISKIMNISENATRIRIYRIREKLKDILEGGNLI